jgi:1-acyl-sn-glycerol-3-phosphate acyltransferase
MTDALRIDGGELPSTSGVRPPRRGLLSAGRPLARSLIRAWYDLKVHGADRFPTSGPVVVAGNHVGWLDGPLLAISSPRPVHALTKLEMFTGVMGPFLRASGQIPLDRWHVDLAAIRIALRALQDGQAIGVFPEGARGPGDMSAPRSGAAYLALVSGAPVVPVSFLGSRVPGGSDSSIPPRGSRIAMTFGEPVHLDRTPWPRTQQQVAEAAQAVTAAILTTMQDAEAATGMTLPGPLGPKREKKKA